MDGATRPSAVDAAPRQGARAEQSQRLLAAGGMLAALGASSCCVLPLVLLSLGVGGAWMSKLTVLAPYEPYFLAAAALFVVVGFVRVYRRPAVCADGSGCKAPASSRIAKIGLWLAAALIALAVAFPYVAPLFLDL